VIILHQKDNISLPLIVWRLPNMVKIHFFKVFECSFLAQRLSLSYNRLLRVLKA